MRGDHSSSLPPIAQMAEQKTVVGYIHSSLLSLGRVFESLLGEFKISNLNTKHLFIQKNSKKSIYAKNTSLY